MKLVTREDVYFALTMQWQLGRRIREKIDACRQEDGKRGKVSGPSVYLQLAHLVDEKSAEEKTEPKIVQGHELKEHFYRLTTDGYNHRQELVRKSTRGLDALPGLATS